MNEEIIKSDLRFRNGASVAVKLWHYHGQSPPLLFLGLQNGFVNGYSFILCTACVYLGKILLGNPAGPLATEDQGSGGIADISTLDQHPFDDHWVHRDTGAWPRLGTLSSRPGL